MKKLIFSLAILVIFSTVSFSQITITQSDYSSLFTIGSSTTSAVDTVVTTIDIGQLGGNNTWDFSSYIPQIAFSLENVDPSSTPYSSNFTGSTIAQHSLNEYSMDTTNISIETWSFFSTSPSVLSHGFARNQNLATPNTQFLSTSVTTHIPAFEEYQFPITLNSTWTVSDSTSTVSESNGIPGLTSTKSTTDVFVVDAWGTMTMPSGKVLNALRIKNTETTRSYVIPGFPPIINTVVSYQFVAKSGEILSVSTGIENPPTAGVISGIVSWSDDAVTAIEDGNIVPADFELKQNFPNPFNPATSIEYAVGSRVQVSINVYNILGAQVAELVNDVKQAGTYKIQFNAGNLASGIYLVQMKAGSFSDTRKMTLLK